MTAVEILSIMGKEAAEEAASLAVALVREYAEDHGDSGVTAARWARQRLSSARAKTAAAKARAKTRTSGR